MLSFLGPAEGKVKNLNLFLLLDIRWISRSLANGRGSMDADSKAKATNGTAVDFSDLKIIKRDKK